MASIGTTKTNWTKSRAQGGSPPGSWWSLWKIAYQDWNRHKAPRLGAALAYYTVFSLAPLLLIVASVTGWVFGEEAVTGEIKNQLTEFLGDEAATGVQAMVQSLHKPGVSVISMISGVIALLFGASGLFGELQDALNTVWDVERFPKVGIWRYVRDRFLSFAMVAGVCFLLLVSLVISAMIAAAGNYFGISPTESRLMYGTNLLVSFAVITCLFALILKILPDVRMGWSNVWIGAVATALLFTVGKYLFGLYLGYAAVGSTYGAAGTLVIVMLWAYYSSQILFFGAEFTQAFARWRGAPFEPTPGARFRPQVISRPAESASRSPTPESSPS